MSERLRRDRDRQRRRAAARSSTASPPRASASCCSSAATGCRASRRTGSPQDVFVDNRYVSPDTWYDADGKPFQPQVHYFVGGATKLYGAALYRLREEDFGELRHHDGISPAWPIGYDEMEPYYTQAEQLYQVHGARGEDPTEPPASAPYPFPAVSHEPRIQQLVRRPRGGRAHPFHAPCGIMLDEGNMPLQQLRALPRTATASRASCTPSPTPRCSACGPALEHPNVTLLTNAEAVRARDQRGGHGRHRGRGRARRRARDLRGRHRRRLLRRRQLGQAAARLGQRQAPATASPTAPTRSGATTCSTTARRCWRSPRRRTRRSSRRRSALNDFYFAGGDFEFPLGNIQMVGKSQAPMYRGEKPLRDQARADVDARARSPATRSTSGSRPRTCRGPRTA